MVDFLMTTDYLRIWLQPEVAGLEFRRSKQGKIVRRLLTSSYQLLRLEEATWEEIGDDALQQLRAQYPVVGQWLRLIRYPLPPLERAAD